MSFSCLLWLSISIHAPPRGATLLRELGRDAGDFNSRPSARGDTPGTSALSRRTISIHAPPRGATHKPDRATGASRFQFTPLREGRRATRSIWANLPNFNSRPSARGDFHLHLLAALQIISIHAPPRGATSGYYVLGIVNKFQFTPLREGRPNYMAGLAERANFNSRPSARGDARSWRCC